MLTGGRKQKIILWQDCRFLFSFRLSDQKLAQETPVYFFPGLGKGKMLGQSFPSNKQWRPGRLPLLLPSRFPEKVTGRVDTYGQQLEAADWNRTQHPSEPEALAPWSLHRTMLNGSTHLNGDGNLQHRGQLERATGVKGSNGMYWFDFILKAQGK